MSVKDADLIWQIAVVRRDEAGERWLEFEDPGRCGKCSRGTGCGAALFSRLFSRPDTRIPMPADSTVAPDRIVRVGLAPRWLMMAAAASYLWPVTAFMLGAVLADQLWPGGDLAALLSGVVSALAAGLVVRRPLKSIGSPDLEFRELQQHLESEADSGQFPDQGT